MPAAVRILADSCSTVQARSAMTPWPYLLVMEMFPLQERTLRLECRQSWPSFSVDEARGTRNVFGVDLIPREGGPENLGTSTSAPKASIYNV